MKGTIIAPVGYYRKQGCTLHWEPMQITVQSWSVAGNDAIAVRRLQEATPEPDFAPGKFAAVSIQLTPHGRSCRGARDEAAIMLPLDAAEELYAALGATIQWARQW